MKSLDILDRLVQRMNLAVAKYEAGDQTLGRKVDQHEECLGALLNAVSDLGKVVLDLELQAAQK